MKVALGVLTGNALKVLVGETYKYSSMGSSPEEFVELRRLLAVKRAEQPPPGYFNTFAGKVIARIEAQGLAAPKPWWTRWMTTAAWAPGMAGANTAIFAGLAMLGGAGWYFKSRPEKVTGPDVAGRMQYLPANAAAVAEPPIWTEAQPQFAGFDPQQFLRPVNMRASLVQMQPLVQFQIRRPSVQDSVTPIESDTVPAGIFDPWARRSLPTSILHQVEQPRPR